MKLSIIVCVFNEVSTIGKIYDEILNVNLIKNIEKEIFIIDNNSTDGTKEILKKINNSNTQVIYQKKNMGKGSSIIEGIKRSTGYYTVFQDADLEYSPKDYNKLLKKIIDNDLDAVFGSRIKDNINYHVYYLNALCALIFTKLINFFYNGNFTDTATGHKLIKSNILKKLNLESKSFALDFEIAIKLSKLKISYGEVSIDFNPRKYNQGKKIRLLDALKSLYVIFYNLIK